MITQKFLRKFFTFTLITTTLAPSCMHARVDLIVFIHGSIFGLIPTRKLRSLPILRQDQVLLDEGLHEIPREKIDASIAGTLPPAEAADACYYILAAYNALAETVEIHSDKQVYAAFGWSGALNQEDRKKAGYRLYTELCDMRNHYQALYNEPVDITIYAHSHGSNVAGWLPYAPQARQKVHKKQKLVVKDLYLFGTPFQEENARFITSPLFKTIISCYSDGDWVPSLDIISTRTHKSYTKMSDLIDTQAFVKRHPSLKRCDLRLLFNRDTRACGHANIWLLGRSPKELTGLYPLPVVVLTPLMRAQLADYYTYHEAHTTTQLDFCMHADAYTLLGHISKSSHTALDNGRASPNVAHTLKPIFKAIENYWHPHNNKYFKVVKQTLFGIS